MERSRGPRSRMSFLDTLLFSLIAAALSLDQMACFQMLFSRPIFVALILGAMFGSLTEAVIIGVCFELLFLRSIPLKERAVADPTLATAAVLGGIWGVEPEGVFGANAALRPWVSAPFAVAVGLLAAFLSKWFDLRLRGVNTSLFQRLHRVGAVQFTALSALFAKSFGLYLLTILAVQGALPKIMVAIGPSAPMASAIAWVFFLCVCVAYAAAPLIQGVARRLWIAGVLVGTVCVELSWRLSFSIYFAAVAVSAAFIIFTCAEIAGYLRRKAPAA